MLWFWADCEFGSLDVFVCYLHTSDPESRRDTLKRIRTHVRPHAHTLLLGDMNFVLDDLDRINCDAQHMQARVGVDCDYWLGNFATFTEFEQPLYTLPRKVSISKISRR